MASNPDRSKFTPGNAEFSYEDFPFYWIAKVHLTYSQKLEKILKRLGTDIPARRVLLMLKRHGVLSVSDLSNHAVIKPPTMVRIIQRMREEDLVSTATNEEDARVTNVMITAKGEELLAKIHEASGRIFQVAYDDLSDSQIKALNASLAAIYRNLDEY